ncbi:Hydroxyisourate hydrolase [Ramaria rubella]|nr:Hydroxyisourate hydrolase [Ramaria rubella]
MPSSPSPRSPITCHVLDSSLGKPASKVQVIIQKGEGHVGEILYHDLANGSTDSDGRCSTLLEPGSVLSAGIYKIIFKTQEYFSLTERSCFYPFVEISFNLSTPNEHHHIPLLISPYSYTTYRGN